MAIRIAKHPGEFIRRNYVDALGLSGTELADAVGVHRTTMNRVLNGKADLSPELAVKLSKALGTVSAETWVRMQAKHNLTKAQAKLGTAWRPRAKLNSKGVLVAVSKRRAERPRPAAKSVA